MTKSRLSVLILAFLIITLLEGCPCNNIHFKYQDSSYSNRLKIKLIPYSLNIELHGKSYEYTREDTSIYSLYLTIVVNDNDKHNVITYNTDNINVLLNKTVMKATFVENSVFKLGRQYKCRLWYDYDLHEVRDSAKYTGWDDPPIISIDLSTFLTCNNEPLPIDTIYATDVFIGGVIK